MQAKALTALRVVGATALCALAAALVSLVFQHQDLEFRSKVPLAFLILVVVIARKAGEAAAILSTIGTAVVFATLLFQPLNNWAVAAKPARSSLAWFLLGGMVCAHLLSPAPERERRRNSDLSHDPPDVK